MPREDSVCQYTIKYDEKPFEIEDLSKDDRFKDKFYVKDDPSLELLLWGTSCLQEIVF